MTANMAMPGYRAVHLLTMRADLRLKCITGYLGCRWFNSIQLTDLPVYIGHGQMSITDEHQGIYRPPHHEFDDRFPDTLLNEMGDPGMSEYMRGDMFGDT